MKSSSDHLIGAANDQKLWDCKKLKPDAIPPLAQAVINTLPAKAESEPDQAYRDRLSDRDKGIYDWFNKEAGEGKRWEVYCATGER